MSKIANTGTGVDFSKTGDGFITAFLTDAGDPALLQIPAGNWNYEIYASMSSNGGTPEMYAELYVYDGTTFTLLSASAHEILYDGVNLNLYTFAMAVPETVLTVTDRLAIKLYATNSGGKTTTIHTQDSHLCQIITTFTTGLTALNGLTAQVQYFGTGTSGSDFNIVSSVDTHTFNLPTASATKRGALSSADWSTFNGKQDYITAGTTLEYWRGDKTWQTLNTSVVPELTNLYFTDARARTAISLTTTGSTGAATYNNTTGVLNIPNYADQYVGTVTSVGLSAPTGFSVSGSPVTSSGTLALSFASGYSLPTNVKQSNWDDAYTWVAAFPTQTGNTGKFLTTDGSSLSWAANPLGTVTSVDMSVPTGLTVSGNPITTSGTLAVTLTAGYSIPTTANQSTWTTAYNRSLTSAAVTGTTTKTLTLNQQDGGTITASWTDYDTAPVTSVFGRTGAVVATEGDYTLTQLGDVTITSPTTGQVLKYNGTFWINDTDANTGTVTSVAMTVPTGLSIAGSPITSSGTLAVTLASGYVIPTQAALNGYFPYSGGTFTGPITLLADQYYEASSVYGLNANNSDIIGINSIYFNDLSEGPNEGLNFYRSAGYWDSLYSISGVLYYNPNRADNTAGTAYTVIHTGNLSSITATGTISSGTWQGTAIADTYIASAATWNAKQNAITLTTTGTSGAATFVSNTLNIPQYQAALTNPVTGSGTNNYIAKFTSTGSTIGNSLIQDDGTLTSINGAPLANGMLTVYNEGTFSMQFINIGTGGATWQIGATNNAYGSGGDRFVFAYGGASLNSILTLIQATKNVSIGSTTDVSRLYVEGAHTSGRGIISVNSTDIAYLHLSSTSATATEVGVRYAKSNVEKWVLGMVGGGATDYTFRLLGSGLATNVFNINLTTGITSYNYAINVNGDISYYNAGNLNAIITSGAAANGRMYIYSSATADIGFQAAGNSWFLNNLGVGTNSPTTKLDVVGEARIQGGGAVSYATLNLLDNTTSGSNWAIFSGYPALGDFTIRESGVANQLIIKKTTGNATFLGSVTATSFIKTGGTASQYLMADGSVTTGGGGGSQWVTSGVNIYYNGGKVSIGTSQFANNSTLLVGDYISVATSAIAQFNGFLRIRDQLIIHNNANTALESDIICQAASSLQTNGNFSIGTTATTTKLTIYQGSASTTTLDNGITLGNGNGNLGVMIGVKFGTYGDAAGSLAYAKQFIAGWRSAEGAGFGDLILGNYKGSDSLGVARYEDTALKIKKSGNVIIGAYDTTDIQPTFTNVRLQVNGSFYLSNTATDCGQWINAGTGGWSFIQYRNNGTDKFIQGYRDADALYHIAAGASLSTNTGFNMNSAGRIAIGGSSFTGLLTISGAHPSGYGLLNLESSDACLIALNSSTSYDVRIRYKYQSVDQWYVGLADNTTFKWQNAAGTTMASLTQAGDFYVAGTAVYAGGVSYSGVQTFNNLVYLNSTTYVASGQGITWKGSSGTTYDFSISNSGTVPYILSGVEIDLNAPIGMRYGLIYTFKGNGSAAYNVNILNSGKNADELQFLGGLLLNTTSCGFVPPKMTTTQRNALNATVKVAGCIIYNTTLNTLQCYNGSAWADLF
jgi:hypothetical protein